MKEIIKQHNNMAILKITSNVPVGDKAYKSTRYEIWTDVDKMNQGIHTSEEGVFYCRGFAGPPESEVIEVFENMVKRGS